MRRSSDPLNFNVPDEPVFSFGKNNSVAYTSFLSLESDLSICGGCNWKLWEFLKMWIFYLYFWIPDYYQASMSDKQIPEDEALEPSSAEQNLIRGLRRNPILAEQIQVIVKRYDQEVADGMDADEAESSFIDSLQKLGVTMMSQWAQNTQKAALEQALQQDSTLNKHSKKNFSGIPPSAP